MSTCMCRCDGVLPMPPCKSGPVNHYRHVTRTRLLLASLATVVSRLGSGEWTTRDKDRLYLVEQKMAHLINDMQMDAIAHALAHSDVDGHDTASSRAAGTRAA